MPKNSIDRGNNNTSTRPVLHPITPVHSVYFFGPLVEVWSLVRNALFSSGCRETLPAHRAHIAAENCYPPRVPLHMVTSQHYPLSLRHMALRTHMLVQAMHPLSRQRRVVAAFAAHPHLTVVASNRSVVGMLGASMTPSPYTRKAHISSTMQMLMRQAMLEV